MEYDLQAILKSSKYPTIVTTIDGKMLSKTRHKILRHAYLRKGADIAYIVFENSFRRFARLKRGEKATAVLKLDDEYNVSVERRRRFLVISVVDKVQYDLNRLPLFDEEGALLVRQSALSFNEIYIPMYFDYFVPANGFSIICYIAKRMFEGGELSFVSNFEDSNYASYGDERRFYSVVSSMIAIAVECDIGDKVFAGGMPNYDGYRIVVTAKVYEGKETENQDTPTEAEEELWEIRRIAKENYWLFSAHIGADGMMTLSLDLATHGYPKLLLVTRNNYRNFPAIPAARFGRVRHKGRPY